MEHIMKFTKYYLITFLLTCLISIPSVQAKTVNMAPILLDLLDEPINLLDNGNFEKGNLGGWQYSSGITLEPSFGSTGLGKYYCSISTPDPSIPDSIAIGPQLSTAQTISQLVNISKLRASTYTIRVGWSNANHRQHQLIVSGTTHGVYVYEPLSAGIHEVTFSILPGEDNLIVMILAASTAPTGFSFDDASLVADKQFFE